MRIKETLRNSIYGIMSYILTGTLGLIIRKTYLDIVPIDFLGYEGLFGSIFALISLAELGMGSVIMFRLFPAFARKDTYEISRILNIYRYIYRIVGICVLIIGVLLIPFIHLIIPQAEYNWSLVYIVYIFQLLMTVITYFLGYMRILFTVSQKEYECIKIDTIGSVVFGLMRLLSLLILRSYFVFLLCNFFNTLICLLVIHRKAQKEFPQYSIRMKVSIKEIKEMGVGKEIKDNFVQKICGVIYGGTDNIIITATLGVKSVGLLNNYILLLGYIQKILDKLLGPLLASIGNYVYSDNSSERIMTFRMFDFLSFCVAAIVTSCLFCLINPTIQILFGEQYLFGYDFVAAFCLNQYIAWNHCLLCYYRTALGRYDLDKFPIAIAAVLNILCSIIFCKFFGIAGIMLGTVIGHLGFWYGRVKVVYSIYIREQVGKYVRRQIIRVVICTVEVFLSFSICRNIVVSIYGLVMCFFVSVLIPIIVNGIVFCRTPEMKKTCEYVRKTIRIIKARNE